MERSRSVPTFFFLFYFDLSELSLNLFECFPRKNNIRILFYSNSCNKRFS